MSRAELLQILAALLSAAASFIAAAEVRLVKRLRAGQATDPDHAVGLGGLRPLGRWRLSRLRSAGAVQAIGPDAFYLDEARYGAMRHRRRVRAVTLVAIAVALGLLYFVVG
jgi:hypothetical protein